MGMQKLPNKNIALCLITIKFDFFSPEKAIFLGKKFDIRDRLP